MKKSFRQREAYRRAKLSTEQTRIRIKEAPLRVCLVFPNTYHVGMSNLAVHCLYALLNSRGDCTCERSFCEEPLSGYSLETGTQLSSFDIVAFTVSFELDCPKILRVLQAARLPLRSAERTERQPLIIAGGPCMFSNPEPIAEFVDAVAVGEGEELFGDILEACSENRRRGRDRLSLLHSLSHIPGVYVPSFYAPVYDTDERLVAMNRRAGPPLPVPGRIVSDLDRHPCGTAVLTPNTEFANMFLVELGRGCRRGCRFCSACHTYSRRNRSLETVMRQIEDAGEAGDRVGLVTSDFSDYPQREGLLKFLLKEQKAFSVSSIRADAITDDVLAGMRETSQKTLTVAPEVASEKLMSLTGKRITSDVLLEVTERALRQGIRSFRLYFMVGFPHEDDEDVFEIVRLVAQVNGLMQAAAKRTRKIGKLTISVNPFVPKPFTPMESEPFADQKTLSRRIRILRGGIAHLGNTVLISESSRMARLQCAIARGDRQAGALVEAVAVAQSVTQAMRRHARRIERYTGPQPPTLRPWHVIEPPSRQNRTKMKEGFN